MEAGDQWGFELIPSHGGSSGSPNPACCYFPSSERHDWSRHTQQPAESPTAQDQLDSSELLRNLSKIWKEGKEAT